MGQLLIAGGHFFFFSAIVVLYAPSLYTNEGQIYDGKMFGGHKKPKQGLRLWMPLCSK